MTICICGQENCKHYNVFDGKLVLKDPKKHYYVWEDKDTEDFKDEIIEKNVKAAMEDGMY